MERLGHSFNISLAHIFQFPKNLPTIDYQIKNLGTKTMESTSITTPEMDILYRLKHGSQRERSAAINWFCNPEWTDLAGKAVISAGGRKSDVDDVFNESLAALIRNIMEGKFKENSQLSTYFYAICKFRYLKLKKPESHLEINMDTFGGTEPSLENVLIDEEKRQEKVRIIHIVVNGLGEPCASLLKYWSLGYSFGKMGELVGSSADTAKNQTYRCRIRMRKSIESNPELYKKLKSLR